MNNAEKPNVEADEPEGNASRIRYQRGHISLAVRRMDDLSYVYLRTTTPILLSMNGTTVSMTDFLQATRYYFGATIKNPDPPGS